MACWRMAVHEIGAKLTPQLQPEFGLPYETSAFANLATMV